MINELHQIQELAQYVLEESAKESPDREAIQELLTACNAIDDYYREFCDETDRDCGDPEGTTYETGISLEFQIEAEWWHDVSIALRKLKSKD